MAQTIHFNTGRPYTIHGQRITATLHDDGVVTFWDHDRMVDGELNGLGVLLEVFEVRAWYDRGDYRNTTRSWTDGMTRGGCNSVYAG